MTSSQKAILDKPLQELELNKELIELLEFHSYTTLSEVLEKGISFHRNRNGLTIHDELELFKFVKENGLGEFWKM